MIRQAMLNMIFALSMTQAGQLYAAAPCVCDHCEIVNCDCNDCDHCDDC